MARRGSKPFPLDAYLLVGAPSPVDPAEIAAFPALFGAPPPPGYAELFARFGRNVRDIGRSFFGLLALMAPDRCRAYNDGLRKTAAEHRMRSYFDGGPGFAPYAPNYAGLFSTGDGENLISLANSVDAEDIVMLPGLDELFLFPNPRSGKPIQVVEGTLVDALGVYGRSRDFELPFFIAAEGTVTTRHKMGDGRDWTTILADHTTPDAIDEGSWSFFYREADACVMVGHREIVVHTGRDHESFRGEEFRRRVGPRPRP